MTQSSDADPGGDSVHPPSSPAAKAMDDLRGAFFGIPVWWHLARHDIRQRYRRSLLGPFWLTISTGVMVGAMGPLYGMLFKMPMGPYFRHLAVSIVVWNFIASCLNESCTAYIAAEGFIKEVRLPYTVHVLRVLSKNLIIFAHNLVVAVVVLMFFPPTQLAPMGLLIPGLLLTLFNLFWLSVMLALLCARFRDIPQIVGSIIQVAFFLTPIVWKADMLNVGGFVTTLNPLYHLVEVIRTPLLGEAPSAASWYFLLVAAVAGGGFTFRLFAVYRSRLAFWV